MGLVSTILVRCKNSDCSRKDPIRLPDSTPEERTKRQLGIPILWHHSYLACPDCGAVFVFQPSECEWNQIRRDELQSILAGRVAVAALRPCGELGCESHIEIHTVVASGLTIPELYPIIRTWHFLYLTYCPSGHRLRTLPPESYEIRLLKY